MFKSRSETPGRLQRKESTPPSILTTTTEEASPVASSSSSSSPVGAATPTTSAPTTPTNAAQTVREDNNNISSSPQPNSDSDSDVPSPLRLRSGSGIIALPGLTPKNGDQIRPSLPFRKPSLRIQPATAATAAGAAGADQIVLGYLVQSLLDCRDDYIPAPSFLEGAEVEIAPVIDLIEGIGLLLELRWWQHVDLWGFDLVQIVL
eukprot:GEZU01016898.1.p1 GENE.GEZU01016898.1~~GEZU01016898.1.p1  ORF type:complete len:205 (-),score=41.21 GEZU01016898.1:58-672(-)